MKRNRLLLVLAIVVVLTMVLASCKCTHEEYTDWTITKDPTTTATGTAERKCVKCGEPETKTIPELNDTSVWTKSATESVAPTHSTAGKDVYTSEYGTVTVPLDPIDHTFDQEVAEAKYLKDAATCTTVAVYYKSCSCGVASTTLTFNYGEVLGHDAHHHDLVPATCETDGTKEHWTCSREEGKYFTSEECTAEVEDGIVIGKLGHDVGEGTITVTTEPTLDAAGTATFTCVRENCPATDHLATVTLEQLSDTSAWTVVNTPADYERPETTTYTHKVYTSVVVTKTNGSPLALPYAGKSYAVVEISSGSTNGVNISNPNNIIGTVNADATKITGTAYPLYGDKTIASFDGENGTLLINGISAWIDTSTGFIVMLRSVSSYNDFYLLIPVTSVTNASETADRTAAVNAAKDKVSASQWNGNFAVTYTADATPYGIFVTSDSVTLGVTFADETGAALAADACKTSEHGVIVSKGETLVAVFETVDSALVKYSRYTNGSDILKVYTDGTFAIGAKKGTFTVNSNETLDAYVVADGKKVEHYTITLSDDGTYTLADVKAEITFVVGEGGTLEQTVQSLYVGCVITVAPTVNSPETTAFVGWYTDLEDDETLVTSVPAAAATLYAKYSTLVTYHVVDTFGGNKDVKIPSGQNVLARLPQYTDTTINAANNTVFAGWQYVTAEGETRTLASDEVAGEGDEGMTLTAVWSDLGRWTAFELGNGAVQPTYDADTKVWTITNKDSTTQYLYFRAKGGKIILSFNYYFENGRNADTLKITKNGTSTTLVSQIRGDASGASTPKPFSITLNDNEYIVIQAQCGVIQNINNRLRFSNVIINGREITKTGEYDMKEGTYTCAGKSDLELDGYGTFTLGEFKGTYTVDSTDRSKLTATVIDTNGKAVGLYDITLDGTAYTAEVGKIEVTYNYGTADTWATRNKFGTEKVQLTAYEEYVLPTEGDFTTKVDGGVTYVFIGWFASRAGSDKITSITPTSAVEIYARYVDASTLVTVTYNHNVAGVDDKTVRVEKDKAVGELYVPTVTNGDKVFVGWFTKDGTDGDYGDEVTSASVFSEDVTVYAKWVTPNPMQGIYKGFNFAQYCITNEVIVVNIDAEGNAAVTVGSAAGINGSVIEKQSADNVYRFVSGTSYYYAYFDGETLSVSTDSNQDFFGDYVNVFAKVDSADVEMTAVSNYMYPISWRDDETGLNRIGIVSVQVGSGAEEQIYYVINTHAAKVALTVVDANGQAVTSESAYNTYGNVITITNDNGVNVTKVYNGTTWVDFDSYKGSYTDDTWGPFTIDGIKRVIIGNHSYEYTIVSDGVISVTINNRYYEISNMSAPTCTVTPYNTTVTFVIANGTVEGVNDDGQFVYGINTQITLPTPTLDKGYGFFGWYDNAEYTGNAVTTVTFDKATASKTYYAKVEEVPAWSSMSTAEELKFEDNSATFTGETTAANKTAYAKFVVDQDGNYYLYGTASKVGGDGNFSYARYTVISENGEAVLKSVCSYSSNTALGPYSLSAGTYFLQTHLGGNIVGNGSNNQDVYGTFSIQIVRALHTTADTAIEYTVGTEVTAIIQSVGEKTLVTVYKVELDVNKSYTLTYTPTSNSRLTIVPDPTKTTTNTVANTYWTSAAKTVDLSFGSQQSGTYYIVVDNAGSKFVINEKVVSEDISFAGQTYRYSADNYNIMETETWEITFTTETTGTIITNTEAMEQLYKQTYAFTDVKVDAATKTITFVTTKKGEVTATYSADGTTITFDSSCGISECNGKVLSK